MVSRLANDITISIGHGQPIRLRASLRAAIRLERRFGFAGLLAGIAEANITTMRAIVTEAAIDDSADLMQAIEFEPLRKVLPALQAPLVQLVEALIDPADTATGAKPAPATGKPSAWPAYFDRLFALGTGWLGWSPADTLDATPAEIIAAFEGRQEMIGSILKAVFGSSDEEPAASPRPFVEPSLDPVTGMDPTFDRAGLHALKGKL